ncbi:branched-chain amino acid ABC transporter ATP-binding protein/permease [Nonomuraea endophytica]|uniref:Branched-chain amino acid transport system permease protein n=1 Tax=Nonomuraea endophytica TaxID=714136 RepID=A0A7W8AAG1_9ACTN|nr:ATP-binding cassette domain-containing protein [Nonomuraea endophytica]MBB5081198.1 branched-chain amino acid transport system permease protein [Nonomuraea endophytica]
MNPRAFAIGLGVAVAVCVAVPAVFSAHWVFLAITAVVVSIIMQSYGVIVGRAGMMSLCQMSFAAIGAWVVLKLNLHDAPGGFLLWLVLGGLAAVPVGVLIGLPALRIRGVNLAVVTFGFAVSTDIVLNANQFPGTGELKTVVRPELFSGDRAYFVLTVIVFCLVAIGLSLFNRTRLGMSWLELKHSERAAAAHGVSVARSKLAAFAISAFVAAIGGGLMAGQLGLVVAQNFSMGQSLAFFAVAILIGPHHVDGAIMGGVFGAVMATILERLSLPQDLGGMLFGVFAVLALRSGVSQTDFVQARRRERAARPLLEGRAEAPETAPLSPSSQKPSKTPSEPPGRPLLQVSGLTVRFGEVTALDEVTLTVPEGAVAGLIGPNGAGKSTFIAAVTGFLGGYRGSIVLAGQPLDGLRPDVRAGRGLRRTFQTTTIPAELTQYEYLTIGAGRRLDLGEAGELLDFFGCPPAQVPVSLLDAGTRRLLDVAAAVAARPKVALLDEPAAGQSGAESLRFAARLAEVPARYGVAVLLVEHDMELVTAACSQLTVLDFGRVIASGPTRDVMEDPAVVNAYLGIAAAPLA